MITKTYLMEIVFKKEIIKNNYYFITKILIINFKSLEKNPCSCEKDYKI